MLLTIVLFVFALHVLAWMVLPGASRQRAAQARYRPVAAAMALGEPLES